MDKNNQPINTIAQLKKFYKLKKSEILSRLKDFSDIWNQDDKKIFAELCFCITTPQSKAESCNEIVTNLEKTGLLFSADTCGLYPHMKKTRFYKNKSRYITEARAFLKDNGCIRIKDKIDTNDIFGTREWLVKNIKGIGYKEASHFLRNIGFGKELAILDVHILRNLKKFKVIKDTPKTLSRKTYLEIEDKLIKFAKNVDIPVAGLDLLFWSMQTGKIFK